MNGCLTVLVVLFLLPFAVVIGLIVKLVIKGKNEGWKGEVIDKVHNTREDMDDNVEELYSLTVRMTDGKEHHIGVSASFWNSCKIGDIVEKPKGALYPKKVKKD